MINNEIDSVLPLYMANKKKPFSNKILDEKVIGYIIKGENTYIISKEDFYYAVVSTSGSMSTSCHLIDENTLDISFDNGVNWKNYDEFQKQFMQ